MLGVIAATLLCASIITRMVFRDPPISREGPRTYEIERVVVIACLLIWWLA